MHAISVSFGFVPLGGTGVYQIVESTAGNPLHIRAWRIHENLAGLVERVLLEARVELGACQAEEARGLGLISLGLQ